MTIPVGGAREASSPPALLRFQLEQSNVVQG